MNLEQKVKSIFKSIGGAPPQYGDCDVFSPINNVKIGSVELIKDKETIDEMANAAKFYFNSWKSVPAPLRGDLIRIFGNELRKHKKDLGTLVTIESGKILQEGLGEVQEMIDICDFAVGLSRQLYGLTMPSERPDHRLMETWHPIGPVVVISSFNFPVAVWAWNFALAVVCGNPVIWKPSEKTPLTAFACRRIYHKAVSIFMNEHNLLSGPYSLLSLAICRPEFSEHLIKNKNIALVSATGSTLMGKRIAPLVAERLGRSLLELGGNNGMIVTPSADLNMAVKAITFSAIGTSGQRCTTLRRLFVHEDIYSRLLGQLKIVWKSIKIGDPLDEKNLMGPLIDHEAVVKISNALERIEFDGGTFQEYGVRVDTMSISNRTTNNYVQPVIAEMPYQTAIVKEETFAPILYVMKYKNLDDAIEWHNDVPQGLSSCIFSNDIRETEKFLLKSDCGIANVNIGPSGAEIGGAFGGEKETGGGRESGSDAWKNYMRRQTTTINCSDSIPLAQGIKFDI